jgi:glycosyltransferase involved in cell wall biosynthesis
MKQRLIIIGNAYWVEVNRTKAEVFSQWFEVACVTHSPRGHELMGKTFDDSDASEQQGATGSSSYELYLLEAKGSKVGGTKFTLLGLSEVMQEFKADVILVETEPWAWLFWQVVYNRRKICPDARLGLFSWENIRRPGVKGLVLDQFYRAAGWCLDFVVAGNREAKALFERGGVDPKFIHIDAQLGFNKETLPLDPVEGRLAYRKQWGSKVETVIIGFCGRYVPEKGVWDIIEAVRLLREEIEIEVELHFLGGGELVDELGRVAEEEDWFKLHDFVPHTEVPSIMNAWDVFVLPSKRLEENGRLWEEQFGHVLLNAMGVGCLTLGSRSGAIPEVLGDDEDVIFEPGNPGGLKDLIKSYIPRGEKWEDKVSSQKKRAIEHYSFDELGVRYYKHMRKCGAVV